MKAVGYIRVSTQKQVSEGVSMDAQRAKIEAWCLANDYELTAIYEDAGISGSRSDREGLQKAIQATGSGDAIVFYSLSRFVRGTKDTLQLAETLKKRGTKMISLTENLDTVTAAGKMLFTIMAGVNEFERNIISERTIAALSHKKAKGEKYGPVPFGYKEVQGRLIEVEKESAIVAEILVLREQGHTLAGIAGQLNTRGIKSKRGGRWYASSVSYLINRQAA